MASRIEPFTVTVAAGTLSAAPVTTAISFAPGTVERIEIIAPAGHVGLTGFQIRHGGGGVLPREDNRFIVADNEAIRWDVNDMPDAGDWEFRAYNTDVYPHSWFLRFLVSETGAVRPQVMRPLGIAQPDQPAPLIEEIGRASCRERV